VSEHVPQDGQDGLATPPPEGSSARGLPLSVDWLATLTAGVLVALAVANVLPKIAW
jgi:hypothetical protein